MTSYTTAPAGAGGSLASAYDGVRILTERLAAPLSAEDQTVQSMPDVSPTKWHRAHTTWFFETFLLAVSLTRYRPFDSAYGYVFNSYWASGTRRTAWLKASSRRRTCSSMPAYRSPSGGCHAIPTTRIPASTRRRTSPKDGRRAPWSSSSKRCSACGPSHRPAGLLLVDPHLPEWLPDLRLEGVRVGGSTVDIEARRTAHA